MLKTQKFGKIALQKALKERLALLTQGLAEAERGSKGIELVKEIKELHGMLENLCEQKGSANSKKENVQCHVFTWGPVQAWRPEQTMAQNEKQSLDNQSAAHVQGLRKNHDKE